MPQLSPRGRLLRDAIIYTPLFVLCGGTLLLMVFGAVDRAVIGMFLLAIVTFLFGYQSIQSLRDLRGSPRQSEGPVARRWSKRDAFVAKSHYVTVQKSIFRIPIESYLEIFEGDTVRISAYPHSGTVVSVERLAVAEKPELQAKPVGGRPATGRLRTLRTARATPSSRRAASMEENAASRGDEPAAGKTGEVLPEDGQAGGPAESSPP